MTISYQQPCDLGVVRSGAETQPGARSTGRWVLAAAIIGSSMAFIDGTVVLGLGMAISVAPLTTVVMNAVEEQFAGLASGINNAVSRVGGLIAVALLGVVVLVVFNAGLDVRLAVLDVEPAVEEALAVERIKLAGAQVPAGIDGELRDALERAIDESFVAGFRLIMLIGAGLALCSAIAAALMIQGQRAPAGGD